MYFIWIACGTTHPMITPKNLQYGHYYNTDNYYTTTPLHYTTIVHYHTTQPIPSQLTTQVCADSDSLLR